MQYILPSKFKDVCLRQTNMKTQSNQMMILYTRYPIVARAKVSCIQMMISKYLKVKLIMMIEVLEMIQTSNSETEKFFSVFHYMLCGLAAV